MDIEYSENAVRELDALDKTLRQYFINHVEKLAQNPTGRHMRFGLPFYVEEVTRQARLVYYIETDRLFILHCFSTHKDYEKWYNQFR
jgi:mRNA-degrading endonuclease RelE of RelBE toxin-antitoxin system